MHHIQTEKFNNKEINEVGSVLLFLIFTKSEVIM